MIAWLLKMTAKMVALLPLAWAMVLARHWGWVMAHVVRLRRTYVLNTLARCFPEKTKRERRAIYDEMCRHQATNLVELMRFAGGREAELGGLLEAHGEEIVKAALSRGKGVLILIAHFGNYDLMGLYASKLFGYPLTVITKTLKNAKLNALWWEMRRKAGVNEIAARNAYRACVRSLRNNELVGFMLDQNRPHPQGVYVDFFGKLASTTPGLAFISAQTEAPVVPVFMRRTPEGRHVLEARPILEPPPDRKEETLLAFTAACTKIIEEEIRRYPSQWLWLHKRWKSHPEEPASEPAAKTD
jgi:Kdo2-lipid IVA lauroyltransferase/acyltransferase